VFFMRGGQVRLDRPSGDTWTYLGNWLIGSYEAILDTPYNGNAVAIADFSALSIRASEWSALMEDSMQLVRRALMRTSKAISALEDRFVDALPTRPNVAWWAPPAGPWGVVERIALLADVRMLRGAGVQVLADLAAISREVSWQPGEVVLKRHVPRHELIILAEGTVEATRVDPPRVHPYGPGDLINGAAAFGEQALAWEVRATSPARGVACAIDAWFDLMEEHYELARSTFAALVDRRETLLDALARPTGNVTLT
jgi:CRP-like cAMP-binding protein